MIQRPNTKSSHYRPRTCKVRACKVRNDLNNDGYCRNHTKSGYNNADLYEKCRECSEMVDGEQYGVECEKCQFWYHIECVNMKVEQYKCMIKKSGNENSCMFHWYCRFCKKQCIEAVAKIDLLENQNRNLTSKIMKLDERVDALESKISTNVKKDISSQLDEREDINRRKYNVVVLNLPEHHIEDTNNAWNVIKAKKKNDINSFCNLLNESLDMNIGDGSAHIKDAIRIGATRVDGKPRLLKVIFHDLQTKREVLGKAKLLKS